jgi:hypothetical protein
MIKGDINYTSKREADMMGNTKPRALYKSTRKTTCIKVKQGRILKEMLGEVEKYVR